MATAKRSNEDVWFWGFFGTVICLFLALWALFSVLVPFFLALALAYAFGPLIDRLEKRGIGRGWAVGGLMLGLVLVALALLSFIVPTLLDQGKSFADSFPENFDKVSGHVADLADKVGVNLPGGHELVEKMRGGAKDLSFSSIFPGVDLARKVLMGIGHVLGVVFALATVPIFFFFLLVDLPRIKQQLFKLIPRRHQALALEELHKVDQVLSRYVRGQLTMSVLLGTVYSIVLTMLGVKFGLFIGILTGFLNVVPYIGQFTGLCLAMVMVSLEFKDWTNFWAVPAAFACTNFIEANFITPRVVGGSVGLSIVQTILAVTLGAHLGGILGVALALPVAGTIKVLALDVVAAYQKSSYYRRVPGRG